MTLSFFNTCIIIYRRSQTSNNKTIPSLKYTVCKVRRAPDWSEYIHKISQRYCEHVTYYSMSLYDRTKRLRSKQRDATENRPKRSKTKTKRLKHTYILYIKKTKNLLFSIKSSHHLHINA